MICSLDATLTGCLQAPAAVSSGRRFIQLTCARRRLIRLLQELNFGEIRNLRIRDGEPTFIPEPVTTMDLRLDLGQKPRRESLLCDFGLRTEHLRLMASLDELRDGVVDLLQVRDGLPVRLLARATAEERR